MSETSPITEQANPETELARDRCSPEDLPHDALQTISRTEPVVQVSEQINAELENLSVGAGRTQVEVEEEEEEDVVNDSGRLVKPDAGGSSSGGLKRIPSMTRGFPFPVSSLKPVGQAFENNTNVIWSWLMDDEISIIGIYGMGGIGKTTMLQHIHDELLRRPDISHHVYWVSLSRDFSIHRLQHLIAKHLDLDLSSECNILPRAAKLSEELTKKQEWILILDDLWESFELSAVGIPVPLKGCKVIFTTRSDVICQWMGSQVITKVSPLSEREAWALFMETLRHGKALSPEVERIAVDIARECAGLPLGINTMAGSLREVNDQDEWRITLKILKELKSRYKGDEVFRMIRFSYDRLDDFKLQQCLVYCASFPEDYIIKREVLIDDLIYEGIIQKKWSREAEFDKGHAMLDRLENAGLLQRIDGGRAVKMHDLVKGQRRKSIEMAGSNIKSFWNHVEKMINGIMKYIENTGEGCVQHVDRSFPPTIDENYNRREATVRLVQPAVGASSFGVDIVIWSWLTDDEVSTMNLDIENTGEGSVDQHVDRSVPPTIDENYNRREATERLVKPSVAASAFVLIKDVAGDAGTVPAATTMGHAPGRSVEEYMRSFEALFSSDYAISVSEQEPNNVDLAQQRESGWTLLMTNLILEIASAVFGQMGYALVGMVLAFVALLLATAELIDMARKERMSLLPSSLRPSTTTLAPGKPVGTIVEYFGLVAAVWQCFYSTVEYAYDRQKRDNPIKMCLIPFIFLLCVAISKLIKNSFIDESA